MKNRFWIQSIDILLVGVGRVPRESIYYNNNAIYQHLLNPIKNQTRSNWWKSSNCYAHRKTIKLTYSFIAWLSVTLFLCGCIYNLSFLVQHIWNLPLYCSQAFSPNWKVCSFLALSKFARFVVCIPIPFSYFAFYVFFYNIFNRSKIQISPKYTNVLKPMETCYLKIVFFPWVKT